MRRHVDLLVINADDLLHARRSRPESNVELRVTRRQLWIIRLLRMEVGHSGSPTTQSARPHRLLRLQQTSLGFVIRFAYRFESNLSLIYLLGLLERLVESHELLVFLVGLVVDEVQFFPRLVEGLAVQSLHQLVGYGRLHLFELLEQWRLLDGLFEGRRRIALFSRGARAFASLAVLLSLLSLGRRTRLLPQRRRARLRLQFHTHTL